jgi:hypothetical protein
MAERYTSLMALVLDEPVDDVGAVVETARVARRIDRASPVGDGREAQQVLWGGRMQRSVVRSLETADGRALIRVESYVGAEGVTQGMRRQAELLAALAEAVPHPVLSISDLSAAVERDTPWLERVAAGEVKLDDAITVHDEGDRLRWIHSHGAARFDVPDLEIYGLEGTGVPAATAAIRHVHRLLLRGGMKAELQLPDGTPVYLVPVTRAWQHLPLDWPGVGEAGKPRSEHDGPRATLSILTKRRFGRYPLDLDGVIDRLRGGA